MTSPARPRIDRMVLQDRLQLVLGAPGRAASWHWLYEAAAASEKADLAWLLEAVRARRPARGMAAVLAATFLDAAGHDETELRVAGEACLKNKLPLDAGLAVLNVTYSRAMRRGHGGAGLVRILRGCGFLGLSAGLGKRLLAARTGLPPRAAASGLKRVAVVAPSLSSSYHAPTRMALTHGVLLADEGLNVSVFAPQEHQMPDMSHWLGFPGRMALDPPNPRTWPRPAKGRRMPVVLAKAELSMRGRWHSLLNSIESFAPNAVLFVGSYSPLLWPLQARWPVAGLGAHTITPAGPLDLWLAPAPGAKPTFSPPLPAPRVRAHSNRFSVALAEKAKPRAELGLPGKAVCWMTSSTMFAKDLPPAWTARVLKELERHPEAHWLIVSNTPSLPAGVPKGHPRVTPVGYQKEFGAAILACDLYLNPPRMGGGHSVAMAMAHGVPVLALRGGDAGEKLGADAQRDDDAYFATLGAWMRNAGARRKAGAAQRERFGQALELGATGPALVEALKEAMSR